MTPHSSVPFATDSAIFVGIDVAKDHLDLARSDTGELMNFPNDDAGVGQMVELLKAIGPKCIVVESTGGLERSALEAMLDAHLPVALVNPARVRHLAIGLGILAKTDPIDTRVLMQFARLAEPRLTQKRSANQIELDELIPCRRQLTTARTAQANAPPHHPQQRCPEMHRPGPANAGQTNRIARPEDPQAHRLRR